MIHTISFFTWRYVRGTGNKAPLATLVRICFGAILLGTLCLTLVAAIMQGFKKATYTTLQSVHADLVMESASPHDLNTEAITRVLRKEFPMVLASAPRASNFVILESTHADYSQRSIVTLQAIDPLTEAETTSLQTTIRAPKGGIFKDVLQQNQIVVGSKFASARHVHVGDTLTLYYAPDQEHASRTITFQTQTVTISGIFSTGIAEYDEAVAWSSFDLFNTLFDEGTTSIGLRLSPAADQAKTIDDLQKRFGRFGLIVQPWHALYPAFLQALELEEYAWFIILFFIVILASLIMASTLMLHIEQKRSDIALLRAMGMSAGIIRCIFVALGMSIAGTATVCGMLSGWLASWIISTYKLISLPDSYYISYLPAYVSPAYFFILFGIACTISLLVVLYAARTSSTAQISTILRSHV